MGARPAAGLAQLGEPPRTALFGRDAELDVLHRALSRAAAGRGGVVLLGGEAGMGKTALATRLAEDAAAAGFTLAWGRCWHESGTPAFWPWGRIADELLGDRDAAWLEHALGARGRRLGRIAPGLAERLGLGDEEPEPLLEQARFALLDALGALLRTCAAEAPVLVVIDDVDPEDDDALLALEFVASEVRDARAVVLGTSKDHGLREAAAASPFDAGERLELGGLHGAALHELVLRQTGVDLGDRLLERVAAVTDGNPFFAVEVVRLLGERGELEHGGAIAESVPLPKTALLTVEGRLRPLPPEVVEVLETASVVGREFSPAVLAHATGLALPVLADRLERAEAARLVLPRAVGALKSCFAHGLVREALYQRLGTARRGRLHAAVAAALEHIYAGDLEPRLAEIAHHHFEAGLCGDPVKALEFSARAGERSMRASAWDDAAGQFDRALQVLALGRPDPVRRAALLVQLARAQSHAGATQARETLADAMKAAEGVGRPDLAAQAALEFGSFALSPGVADAAVIAALQHALDLIGPAPSPLRARLLARLGVALYWTPDEGRRLAVSADAVAMARAVGDRSTLAYVLAQRQAAASSPDRTEECVALAEDLFVLTEELAEPEIALPARIRQVGYLLELGFARESEMAIRKLEAFAEASHDPRAQAYVPLVQSRREALAGRFGAAEVLTAEAARLGARLRDSTIPLQSSAQLIGMRWIQGRIREMRAQLKASADALEAMPVFRAAHALACLEDGDGAAGRHEVDRLCRAGLETIPRDNVWLLAMAFLAEAVAALADREAAATAGRLLAPFAGRNVTSPDAIYAGPVTRYLGLFAATVEDWRAADEHFTAAFGQARRDGARALAARIRIDHARALQARGAPEDAARAAVLLEEADSIARRLGLTELRERIAAERSPAAPSDGDGAERRTAALRRVGKSWRIDYAGRVLHVNDLKGMRHLAVLLGSPWTDVQSSELEARARGEAPADGRRTSPAAAAEAGLTVRADGDAPLPALDDEAKEQYRRRIADLDEEIERAEAWHDPEALARASEERERVIRELAAAVGLSGRDRPRHSSGERARVAAKRAIDTAINEISKQDPHLAFELETHIQTGRFCRYKPDPLRPLTWRVDAGTGAGVR